MWYEWASIEEFNVWHTALKESLGYPLTPINLATGLSNLDAQVVEEYTHPIQVDGKVIATVEDKYAENLIKTDLRPIVNIDNF